MLFRKKITACDFGALCAQEFLPWVGKAVSRLNKDHRQLSDQEIHAFVTTWMLECASFFGTSISNNSVRMQVLGGYAQEVVPPARMGGIEIDPMEIMRRGQPNPELRSADGYRTAIVQAGERILCAAVGHEIPPQIREWQLRT